MPDALRGRARLGALLLAFAAAHAAHAQHPMAPRARALHARLAQADAVAIATVEEVDLGRIRLGDARALAGSAPSQFQVKRSPGAPPPLEVGDRALLLLRGARSPYLLVDTPEETIRLPDAAVEERFAKAVLGCLRVRERPAAWVPLYLAWIDRGPDALRELGVQGLLDPEAPFQPLRAEVLAELGRAAFDPARDVAARRAAARVASIRPEGGARLAEGLLAAPADADAAIAQTTLRAAPGQNRVPPAAVLLRGLDHADAEVRRTALQMTQLLRGDSLQELRPRLERLAHEDPESWLRADAERVLAKLPTKE